MLIKNILAIGFSMHFEKQKNEQQGFTLIELILVIVLLGILSAFALPRFADFRKQATVRVIESTEGAIRSTSAIFHAEALVNNIDNGTVTIDGESALIRGGYLVGHWNTTWRQAFDVDKVVSFTVPTDACSNNDLCGVGNQNPATYISAFTTATSPNRLVMVWPKVYLLAQNCFAFYFNAEDGSAPLIGSITSGC